MREAVVDLRGVRGPSVRIDWDIDPARVRWPFEEPFENFRLLDPLSRFVAIAVEALGGPFDPDTAIVLGTEHGCLWTDRRFEASRHDDLRPGLFPYTLPSAPLAAIAITSSRARCSPASTPSRTRSSTPPRSTTCCSSAVRRASPRCKRR